MLDELQSCLTTKDLQPAWHLKSAGNEADLQQHGQLDFHGISVWKRPCGCGRHQPHLNLVGLGLRSVPASKSSCLVSPAITPNRSLLICQGKINGLQDIGWLYDIPVVVCCSRCATTTAPTCKDQHSALAGCTGFIDVQLALSYIKYINCLIITDRR